MIVRSLAFLLLAAVVGYPVAAFLRLAEIPLLVCAAWLLVPIAAWRWPWPSLLGFLVVAPLVPMLPSWFNGPSVAPAEILLVGLLIPALLRVVIGRRSWQPQAGAHGLALLLGVIATASLLVILYPMHLAHDGVWPLLRQIHEFASRDFIVAQSQNHYFGSLMAWAMLLEGLALMWLVFSELESDRERRLTQVLGAACAGAVIVAALGVAQWWTGYLLIPFWRQQNPNLTRINATFTDVNGLGSYLAMMVPIALGLAMVHAGKPRWRWRAAAALMMIAVLFTVSRSAWVALALGVMLHGIAVSRLRFLALDSWLGRHAWQLVGVVTATIVVSIGALSAYATVRDVRFYDEDSYFETLLYTVNLRAPAQERMKGRQAFWGAASAMIAARPAFGIGLGRFFKDVAVYAEDPSTLPRQNENAHNYFLQIAAELGLIGLAVWLALLIVAVVSSLRVAASDRHEPGRRHLALAVPVGIVVFLLTWTTGHPLLVREGQFAFWPIVAAAYAIGASGVDRPPHGRLSVAAWMAIAAIALSAPIRAAREADGVNLTNWTSGLHEHEADSAGRPFQWTLERAVFYVPADARVFSFHLRSIAPFEQSVEVVLDGVVANRLTFRDQAWHPVRYAIPQRQQSGKYLRVELVVSPVWRPATDPRVLGVQLRERGWTR